MPLEELPVEPCLRAGEADDVLRQVVEYCLVGVEVLQELRLLLCLVDVDGIEIGGEYDGDADDSVGRDLVVASDRYVLFLIVLQLQVLDLLLHVNLLIVLVALALEASLLLYPLVVVVHVSNSLNILIVFDEFGGVGELGHIFVGEEGEGELRPYCS